MSIMVLPLSLLLALESEWGVMPTVGLIGNCDVTYFHLITQCFFLMPSWQVLVNWSIMMWPTWFPWCGRTGFLWLILIVVVESSKACGTRVNTLKFYVVELMGYLILCLTCYLVLHLGNSYCTISLSMVSPVGSSLIRPAGVLEWAFLFFVLCNV